MPRLKTVKEAIADTKAAGKRIRWSYRDGVSLVVTPTGGARWYLQGRGPDGKTNTVPIGPGTLTMRQALDARPDAKRALKAGTAAAATVSGEAPTEGGETFGGTVTAYLDDKAPHWRGGRDGDEATAYKRTLLDRGALAAMPLASVDIAAVREHLRPYDGKPTSVKVRTRILAVIDWATASGKRAGDNPARIVAKALPNVRKAVKHKAIEWKAAPAFYSEALALDTTASRALAFMVLVPGRSNEIAGMRWREIEGDVWTCPAERAKEGVAYRMPLPKAALDLLKHDDDEFVWGAHLRHGILADITRALKKQGRFDCSPHGLRSTFVVWAGDRGYPEDLRLAAIAHARGNKSDQSYDRGDLFERRREMLQRWADYVVQAPQAAAAVAA